MKYLSLCSGIEAATVAWHPLGWEAVAYSEIERFPSEVLAHHYPNTPNLGDMTKFKEWTNVSNVDLLVGGTPCQSFSVAGLRKGLDDPRGNLMLTYLAIAKQYRPNWLVWENVPGVLSSNGGRDFGSFLGGLAECGYGFAYRVLDAQFFGVAQRRRRVFVVGHLGDWRAAAAVLFERHSLQGHPAPSREKRQSAAASAGSGASVGSLCARTGQSISVQDAAQGHLMPAKPQWWDGGDLAATITTKSDDQRMPDKANAQLVMQPVYEMHGQDSRVRELGETCTTVTSKWGTGGGNVPVALQPTIIHGTQDPCVSDIAFAQGRNNGGENVLVQSIAFGFDAYNHTIQGQVNQPLRVSSAPGQVDAVGGIVQGMAVRRLTPVECERLQGFPDSYTDIKSKNKPTPDGPRYKALGNSMAVPVMAWIGQRIEQVEAICQHKK
jgi:DNA (cytosine-5)-methyltransferase 1